MTRAIEISKAAGKPGYKARLVEYRNGRWVMIFIGGEADTPMAAERALREEFSSRLEGVPVQCRTFGADGDVTFVVERLDDRVFRPVIVNESMEIGYFGPEYDDVAGARVFGEIALREFKRVLEEWGSPHDAGVACEILMHGGQALEYAPYLDTRADNVFPRKAAA